MKTGIVMQLLVNIVNHSNNTARILVASMSATIETECLFQGGTLSRKYFGEMCDLTCQLSNWKKSLYFFLYCRSHRFRILKSVQILMYEIISIPHI